MSGIRYTEEFKRDAVAQVTDRGYSVKDVATRLGVRSQSGTARLPQCAAHGLRKITTSRLTRLGCPPGNGGSL